MLGSNRTVYDLTKCYGKALEEIANAQMTMCKIFDETLSKALESFVQADRRGVAKLKSEAESSTVLAENMFYKYLSKPQSLTPSAEEKTETGSPPNKKGFSMLWSSRDKKTSSAASEDPTLEKAVVAAKWRAQSEEVRLNQATAELKR